MDFANARRTMVENQLRTYDVTDQTVLAAFEAVPREAFLGADDGSFAYLDRIVSLEAGGVRRSLLTPMVLAKIVQLLKLQPEDKVLTIGGGAGYAAAIIAHLAGSVVALEENEALAEAARAALKASHQGKVSVVVGALEHGHKAAAPYSVILVEGAIEVEPEALFEQLAEGGRLLAVAGVGRAGRVMLYRKQHGRISSKIVFEAAAPVLSAFAKAPGFAF